MRSVSDPSDEQTPAIMFPRVFCGAIKKSDEGRVIHGDRLGRGGEEACPRFWLYRLFWWSKRRAALDMTGVLTRG